MDIRFHSSVPHDETGPDPDVITGLGKTGTDGAIPEETRVRSQEGQLDRSQEGP